MKYLLCAVLLFVPVAAAAQPPPGFLADLSAFVAPPGAGPDPYRLAQAAPPPGRWRVEDGRLLHALIIAGVALQGLDAYLTVRSQMAPGTAEGNVALAGLLRDRPRLVGPIKVGVGVLTGVVLWRVHDEAPTAALWTAVGIDGAYGWIVAHDERVLREAGRPPF